MKAIAPLLLSRANVTRRALLSYAASQPVPEVRMCDDCPITIWSLSLITIWPPSDHYLITVWLPLITVVDYYLITIWAPSDYCLIAIDY
jgi:hypothetical protein